MRFYLLLIIIVGLLLVGCATHPYLPFYNTSQWDDFYTGGDGSSTEDAVVINSTDDKKIEDAENHYIEGIITNSGQQYSIVSKSNYGSDGRVYDLVKVVIDGTVVKEYHFDITLPVGQTLQP
jgi:hypothetical protein